MQSEAEILNMCKQHNCPINFFCTANQWHFKPLCLHCIPEHTQKHQKNVKIVLQTFEKVIQHAKQQKEKANHIYQQLIVRIQQLVNQDPNQFIEYKLIQQMESQLINMVRKKFESLRKAIEKQRYQTDKYQKQLLTSLKNNIETKKTQIQSIFIKKTDIDEKWVDIIRVIYFKRDLDVYKNQIDELIAQYEINVVNLLPKQFLKQKERVLKQANGIFENLQKELIIKRNLKQSQITEVKHQELKIVSKKQNSIPHKPKTFKRKKCEYCNQEMEYLTQLKKHLVCRYCGGKQRNYVKK